MESWFSAHEVADMAMELEMKGVAFYTSLAETAQRDSVRGLCSLLAEQEREHAGTFLRLSKEMAQGEHLHSYDVDMRAMVHGSLSDLSHALEPGSGVADSVPDDAACLRLAAKIEAGAVAMYERMLSRFVPEFHETIRRIVEEERRHVEMIRNVQRAAGFADASDGDQ